MYLCKSSGYPYLQCTLLQSLSDGNVTSNRAEAGSRTQVVGGPAGAGRSTSIREGGRCRATLLSGTAICYPHLWKLPWPTVEVPAKPVAYLLRGFWG